MSQKIVNATKTTRPTKRGFLRPWYVLDASKEPMGRLATKAARLLIGKNRADFSPDVDMGAMVVVINANKTVLTGEKFDRKNYFTHSGQVGGLKVRSFKEQFEKDPTKPIYLAIKRMLPKNRHQDLRMNNRLYIFPENHDLTFKLTPAN
jgi:large subunit ribosomal protein L13